MLNVALVPVMVIDLHRVGRGGAASIQLVGPHREVAVIAHPDGHGFPGGDERRVIAIGLT